MLSNAYLLAKFRFDTAENEGNFAEFLPKTDNLLATRLGGLSGGGAGSRSQPPLRSDQAKDTIPTRLTVSSTAARKFRRQIVQIERN